MHTIEKMIQSIESNVDRMSGPIWVWGSERQVNSIFISNVLEKIKLKHPNKNIYFHNANQIAREMGEHYAKNEIGEFREKYFYGVDVLAVEGMDFLNGKTGAQKEFYHLINNLILNKKLVLLSATTPACKLNLESFQLNELLERSAHLKLSDEDFIQGSQWISQLAQKEKIILTHEAVEYLKMRFGNKMNSIMGVIASLKLQFNDVANEISATQVKNVIEYNF